MLCYDQALNLCSLLLGLAPRSVGGRLSTAINVAIPEKDMRPDQLEIKKIQDKWNEVRMMSKEEAEKLEPQWKEAYDRFYEKYHKQEEYMLEIAGKLVGMIEPPRIQKKSKGQRKRDAYAKVLAREAARAAAK